MTAQSAGILLYRQGEGEVLQVLLVHPGGPHWSHKDDGAWSIPKGEYTADEPPLQAALREFTEETGGQANGPFLPLESIRQRNGKIVHAWAAAGSFETAALRSNEFEMEWPPRSGKLARFPEVDRAAWYTLEQARLKINAAQAPLLDRLAARLHTRGKLAL